MKNNSVAIFATEEEALAIEGAERARPIKGGRFYAQQTDLTSPIRQTAVFAYCHDGKWRGLNDVDWSVEND